MSLNRRKTTQRKRPQCQNMIGANPPVTLTSNSYDEVVP